MPVALAWLFSLALLPAVGSVPGRNGAPGPDVSPGPDPVVQVVDSPFGRSSFQVADLDGDGDDELLIIGSDGRFQVYDAAGAATDPAAVPQAVLAPVLDEPAALEDPERSLVTLAPLLGRPSGLELVSLGPRGLVARAFGPGGVPAEPQVVSRTARFRIRTGHPTFAGFVQDVNRDGLQDVMVPSGESCELWLNQGSAEDAGAGDGGAGESAPTLRRAARIRVALQRWGNRDAEALSYLFESAFSIPGLQTRDLNGDERPDLLVVEGERRAFHLQREDGGFAAEPDVELDLGIFRDTDFDGGVKPGQPLVIEAGANFEIRDLSEDGVPDYVIAHGRKVWVFLGGADGPQFQTPASILRSAEDVTALTVLELDGDGRPDLLLIKVQVPTVASLIRGLVSEWDISISAAGYRNATDGSFETRPEWKSELTVRLPSIVRILRDPAEIVRRFEDVESQFRVSAWADVEGDGARDLVLVSEDETRLDVWAGRGDESGLDGERILRELLFEETERVYDLDRAFLWLGSLADRRIAALTEGRAPDRSVELRDPTLARLASLQVGDPLGDGRELLALGYRSAADARLIVDLVRP